MTKQKVQRQQQEKIRKKCSCFTVEEVIAIFFVIYLYEVNFQVILLCDSMIFIV